MPWCTENLKDQLVLRRIILSSARCEHHLLVGHCPCCSHAHRTHGSWVHWLYGELSNRSVGVGRHQQAVELSSRAFSFLLLYGFSRILHWNVLLKV